MSGKQRPKLPSAGDAFACPLGDGRYSVCRVLLDETSEEAMSWGSPAVFAVASSWIGPNVPKPDDPALYPMLSLNHHAWRNELCAVWIGEEVPRDFIFLGKIEPTAAECSLVRMAYARWEYLAMQALIQWRWDHDREALLAEDAVSAKAEAVRRAAAEAERDAYLRGVTLDELREHRFFPEWTIPSAAATRAARSLMKKTVERLIEIGPQAPESDRLNALQECIEGFNALDAEMGFIETDEREDICWEFEAIVHACGLGARQDLADEWREW